MIDITKIIVGSIIAIIVGSPIAALAGYTVYRLTSRGGLFDTVYTSLRIKYLTSKQNKTIEDLEKLSYLLSKRVFLLKEQLKKIPVGNNKSHEVKEKILVYSHDLKNTDGELKNMVQKLWKE
ncbi:hypothetical protein EFN43_02060 [Pediococcus pentosaceus]|uniref:hypothetical protein n=1 Tax=Pediococcus pentosaceus TaxID=1255 RepID=UPI0021A7A459|nr:hypothetical protein [Pediococcus pentosaceus]MCT3019872.1 hypothetical protein [Pediococcus pentosaceus]